MAAATPSEPTAPSLPRSNDTELPRGEVDSWLTPNSVAQLAELVNASCEQVEDMYVVPHRIIRINAGVGAPLGAEVVRDVAQAFDYLLVCEQERPKRFAASLQPAEGDSEFPPPLRDASAEARLLWAALEAEVTHPIARARLADIVYTLRLGEDPRGAGERAVRASLEIVGGSLNQHDQSLHLVRAWSITREVHLTFLEDEVAGVMLGVAQSLIDQRDNAYGLMPLMRALTMPRVKGGTPWLADANALLDQALTAYRPAHVVAGIAELIRERAGGDQSRAEHASRMQVQAILDDAAAAQDGMLIRHHLAEAAKTGRRLGVVELAEQAEAGLQQAPPVEWSVEPFEIAFPVTYTAPYMHRFEMAASWQEVLGKWFETGSPSGSFEANERTARGVASQSVLRSLVSTVIYREGDLPARTVTGPEAVVQQELVRAETVWTTMHGILLARALDTVSTRFGIPGREQLEAFIGAYGTHPPYARTLATALHLFWVGEYEACVHLAVPKIEAAARALLLAVNAPVYRTEVGETDGHFLGLGALFELLREHDFDPDWERFFRGSLLSEGSNLRNLIAHGFVDEVSPVHAALAIRACAALLLIAPGPEAQRDAAAVRAAFTQPHTMKP
jgi:hypothetical protein